MRKSASESVLSLLRIVAGFMFSLHGFQKLFGFFGGMGNGATAQFPAQAWIAGALELSGGLLVMLGLFTRPVAFVLSGLMAVAYFKAHASDSFWPIVNRGELAALYSFVFLFLSVGGPGSWSLDRLMRGKKNG